ncbi:hypothetical protein MMC30_002760 [Trapelia coarctata]|nr:hypothetical protein [Trapelia coarctata]
MELGSPESLPSEDWISQPRSSAPASVKSDTSPLTSSSNGSQSRIPRYTRSISNPNASGRKSPYLPSSPASIKRAHVLNERTASAINIPKQKHNGPSKAKGTHSRSTSARQVSTSSLDSVQVGTVQHKTRTKTAQINGNTQATPDWKRRVLAGGATSGRQQDLFSPIGLEQVFNAGTTSQGSPKPTPRQRGKKYEAVAIDDFPSSPPPYPPATLGKLNAARNQLSGGARATLQQSQLANKLNSPPLTVSNNPKSYENSDGPFDTNQQHRVISGESDTRNESISIVQVTNGHIDWSSIAKTSSRTSTSQEKRTRGGLNRTSSSASDNAARYNSGSYRDVGGGIHQSAEMTSQSLPDGASVDTDAFATRGGFVNVRRGGYSMDNSFQKRPLSPSSFQPSDVLAPDSDAAFRENQEESSERQASMVTANSLQVSVANGRPIAPSTPRKPNQGGRSSPDPPRSSGSPLKLFDNYDTFTNNRLVRRMSQFERNMPRSSNNASPSEPNPRAHKLLPGERKEFGEQSGSGIGRRISSFGDGSLDDHGFSQGLSLGWDRASSVNNKGVDQNDDARLPELRQGGVRGPKSRSSSVRFNHAQQKQRVPIRDDSTNHTKQGHSHQEIDSQDDGDQGSSAWDEPVERRPDEELENNVGTKRLLASPLRATNPKRRRTVTSTLDVTSLEEVRTQGYILQSIVGRKRKDARYDTSSQVADPEVIANRHMLRPRTLTPTQSHTKGKIASTQTSDHNVDNTELDLHAGIEQTRKDRRSLVNAPVEALAGELAHFALDIAQDITYGNRKTSVTTADFTAAANLIMQNIRAQALPRSGRTSDKNSAMEHLADIRESEIEGSTKEEFSRPPSREGGGTLRRTRDLKPLDPQVISHLARFEERDETGIALSSSMRSLRLKEDSEPMLLESDPPNLRIRENSGRRASEDVERGSRHSKSGSNGSSGEGSRRSPPSSGPSTARSLPTGSSSGSGNKAVIVPEKVSHLLSDHVAGMTFDRTQQKWIRKRSGNSAATSDTQGFGSDATDEDPLKEIPDLSVDELEEMRRIMLSQGSRPTSSGTAKNITLGRRSLDQQTLKDDISATSKPSVSASGRSGDEVQHISADKREQVPGDKVQETEKTQPTDDFEDVEHEISILDGRRPITPKHPNHGYRQPRVVTVAFSSPLENPVQDDNWDENSDLNLDDSPEPQLRETRHPTSRRTSTGSRLQPSYRSRRRISIGTQSFVARPVSRIDEHEELSLVEHPKLGRSFNMDVILSTPQPQQGTMSVPPTTGVWSNGTFHLSPLSDFTIHQTDDGPSHDVAKNRGLLCAHDVEGKYSIAIRELVAKITDVEPYEPYWEHIRKLELQSKNLKTLHMLDDFCTRIEELDVSNNDIGQMDGVPATLRVLAIRQNCLSSLTSWGHLRNLQYLDVSANQIQSLKGFQGLIHLRELIADENQIESLDGVAELNGLLKLRVRRNALRCLDFRGFDMQRLQDLDVHGNQVASIANLHELPALANLNLSDNRLTDLAVSLTEVVPSLRALDVSNNSVSKINARNLPNLQTLHLDRNCVEYIGGLKHLKALTTVSWREQELQKAEIDSTVQFEVLSDVSTLRISGNKLPFFSPKNSFLNLQRLELASAGLEGLSEDFGLQMPNLRFVNLNYNALKDIRPLLGITKLAELLIAGNRLSRLRRTTAVLRKFGNTLQTVDLRGNLFTVGFYSSVLPPQNQEQQLVTHKTRSRSELDGDNQEDVCAARYIVPPTNEHDDQQYRQTLNEDTALRRRVYEMLILTDCPSLTRLDGLGIEKGAVVSKDIVWRRLVELGVIQGKNGV